MPKISVILSAYNAQKYIKPAIESILSQTFTDFEFFIVNDASTDLTGNIISSYKDFRIIKINNQSNKGVAVSANECIEMAKGQYIARMDADDIARPYRFKVQSDFLDSNKDVGLCGSWIKTFGPIKNYIHRYPVSHEDIKFMMFTDNPFTQPGIMFRKSFFDMHGLRYNQDMFPAEDYDLWERAIRFFRSANIPKVLLDYRFHLENASSTRQEKQRQEADKIRIRQLDRILGGASEREKFIFLSLMRKENGGTSEFTDDSLKFLFRLKKAVLDKNEFTQAQIDSFVRPCWSYACKTNYKYGNMIYVEGLKKLGLKQNVFDHTVQQYKALKYLTKNKLKGKT